MLLHFTFAQDFTFGQADTTAFTVYSILIRTRSTCPTFRLHWALRCLLSRSTLLHGGGEIRTDKEPRLVDMESSRHQVALTAALAMRCHW
jgi:hypothetical protein